VIENIGDMTEPGRASPLCYAKSQIVLLGAIPASLEAA